MKPTSDRPSLITRLKARPRPASDVVLLLFALLVQLILLVKLFSLDPELLRRLTSLVLLVR
jgi:hypothetical protein